MLDNEVEEVKTHCKHSDCIYRQYIEAGRIPICGYAIIEGVARGCKISECNKYTPGTKKKPRIKVNYELFWECELYDEGSVNHIIR